jgi:hypothetical protein
MPHMQSTSVKIHIYTVVFIYALQQAETLLFGNTQTFTNNSNSVLFLEYGEQISLVFVLTAIDRDHTTPVKYE